MTVVSHPAPPETPLSSPATAPETPETTAPAVKPVRKSKRRRHSRRWRLPSINLGLVFPPLLSAGMSLVGLGQGFATLATMRVEAYSLPALGGLMLGLLLIAAYAYRRSGHLDPTVVVLFGLSLVVLSVVGGTPEYFGLLSPNGILHRSVLSGVLLLSLGVPALSTSLFYLFGATPRAQDIARYPLILTPIVLILGIYAALAGDLAMRAVQQLQAPTGVGLSVFIQTFVDPNVSPGTPPQPGLLNQLLGTGLLMGATTLISLPIGVATGVFVSEFAGEWEKRVISFATTALRGISALLIALAGVAVIRSGLNEEWLKYLAGFYFDGPTMRLGRGSFLLASLVLSMLVIPIIARATQEGCSSLPRGMREGSAALGATPEYTLFRITLPWASPNILTSVLLGCAEAAGSVSVLLFIGGAGTRGVGLFSETTSLAFSIFYAQFSTFKTFRDTISPYQFAAALELLVLALGLTVIALVLKHHYAARYQGV